MSAEIPVARPSAVPDISQRRAPGMGASPGTGAP
jgi:hypothetical protein